MRVKIISAGMLTTVQDVGRYGLQASGMQVSGVMDAEAADWANFLVGNEELPEQAAVLETTYLGPEVEFQSAGLVAITGGVPSVELDGKEVAPYKAIVVQKGQRLKIGAPRSGMRSYLAVAGGFAVPKVLGSRSTNLKLDIGGWQGRKLAAGDELPIGELNAYAKMALSGKARPRVAQVPEIADTSDVEEIRVILGPQDDYFSNAEIGRFLQEIYTVSEESDRMGYRLRGRAVQKTKQQDLITDGIVFGSIQIPPNGQPIIMLADHQTTGGYPKIATVATVDLSKLAQAMPGRKLRFKLVTVGGAQQLLREREQKLQEAWEKIRAAAKLPLFSNRAKRLNVVVNGEAFDVIWEEMK